MHLICPVLCWAPIPASHLHTIRPHCSATPGIPGDGPTLTPCVRAAVAGGAAQHAGRRLARIGSAPYKHLLLTTGRPSLPVPSHAGRPAPDPCTLAALSTCGMAVPPLPLDSRAPHRSRRSVSPNLTRWRRRLAISGHDKDYQQSHTFIIAHRTSSVSPRSRINNRTVRRYRGRQRLLRAQKWVKNTALGWLGPSRAVLVRDDA